MKGGDQTQSSGTSNENSLIKTLKSLTLTNRNIIPSKRDSPDETMSVSQASDYSNSL